MTKTAWYWIGGIVVVVVIGGIVWVSVGKSGSSSTSVLYGPDQSASQTASGPQTMQDLLSSGSSKTCTFSATTPASSSGSPSISTTGTIYVANGEMRGDFVATNSDGKVENSHMIVMNGTSYIWTDQMTQGFEMAWSSMASSSAMAQQPGSVDVNKPVSYSCSPWVSDPSEFTLPTNITFSTMDMAGMTGGASASACSACANVPAAYQAECRTAMHC